MNCVEAQKYFADLLDDSRNERLRKANDHLTACVRCTQELAALAGCRQLVSSLPPVEPPVGFTTRVMAEVRDLTRGPTVWQRLFLPLRIKFPLQVTAVVLISVLAVFIYQKEPRQRQLTTTVPPASPLQKQDETDKLPPAAGRAPAAESKAQNPDAAGAQGQRLNRSPQAEKPRAPAEAEEQSRIISGIGPSAREIAPPQDSASPAGITPSQPNEKSSPADGPASVRQERPLLSEGAQAKGVPPTAAFRDIDTAAKDRTSAAESSTSAGVEEKRAGSSLDALSSTITVSSDRELILRLKQPARNDKSTAAPSELERRHAEPSPSEAAFRDLDQGRQRAIETGLPQTVWAMIDASQYDGFKKDLARLGSIESESPAPAYKNDAKSSDQLRIKITILPPNYSAQPPSTR